MGNYTNHYFGAYLEIKVSKSLEVRPASLICPSGHGLQGAYCQECGAKSQQQPTRMEYPTLIVDHLLGEEWEDVLAETTPKQLSGTGIILAVGNLREPSGEWLYLSQWPEKNDPYIKDFPTPIEISGMMRDFAESYADIIAALKEVSTVQDVVIKAGYVLDQEY